MPIRKLSAFVFFAVPLLLISGRAQQQRQQAITTAPVAREFKARGITVGIPKAFDNRTLTLMLDTLNDSLSRLQVIDQATIVKAIGAIQGSRLQESAQAFTVQGPATPSLTQEQSTSRTLTPSNGGLIATGGTDTTKQSASQPTVAPAVPPSGDLNIAS